MRVRTAHVIFNEMIYQSYKSRLPVVQTMPRLRSASCRTREIEILSRRITFMTSDLVGFIKCSEMYVNPGNKLGNLSWRFPTLALVFRKGRGCCEVGIDIFGGITWGLLWRNLRMGSIGDHIRSWFIDPWNFRPHLELTKIFTKMCRRKRKTYFFVFYDTSVKLICCYCYKCKYKIVQLELFTACSFCCIKLFISFVINQQLIRSIQYVIILIYV